MASLLFQPKVIQGTWEENHPLYRYGTVLHEVKGDEEIIVKLGITCIINNIQFTFAFLEGGYSYFVEVSEDLSQWIMIADYSQYKCFYEQQLYFPPRYVKYIKLTSTSKNGIFVNALKAFYWLNIPKSINGFQFVSILACRKVTKEGGEEDKVTFYSAKKSINKTEFTEKLKQPSYIKTLRLLLCENSKSSEYDIEASTNGVDWWSAEVTAFEDGSWIEVSCKPYPLLYLKFVSNYECLDGTTSPSSKSEQVKSPA